MPNLVSRLCENLLLRLMYSPGTRDLIRMGTECHRGKGPSNFTTLCNYLFTRLLVYSFTRLRARAPARLFIYLFIYLLLSCK